MRFSSHGMVAPAVQARAFRVVSALTVLGLFGSPRLWADRSGDDLKRNIAWQVALENAGFSPGLIDGRNGPKTELATREFQGVRSLPCTGILDDATRRALGVNEGAAVAAYAVQSVDFAEIGAVPTNWNEKSRLFRLGYESIETALAEKFHCTRGLLRALNPRQTLSALKAGTVVNVPDVSRMPTTPLAAILHVDLSQKLIRVLDDDQRLIGLFHCSIAADKAKRPSSDTRVTAVAFDPDYLFDPKMWPEVKNVDRRLRIPPGPRNPVGRCWIKLGLPGYGIHGTPNPELIGKTGSHGCFRLTNWDAQRLGRMVRVGTAVRFLSSDGEKVAGR